MYGSRVTYAPVLHESLTRFQPMMSSALSEILPRTIEVLYHYVYCTAKEIGT